MENKYFDNVLLAQYFVTGVPLQVYVNGEYLKIVEYDDIDDTHFGLGMRKNGAMVPFDYRFIEHIMIGNNKYTIADVNKAMRADATGGEETPSKETPDLSASQIVIKFNAHDISNCTEGYLTVTNDEHTDEDWLRECI